MEAVRLSPAERRVAMLVAQGLMNKEIARRLVLSVYTIKNTLNQVYRKLEITEPNLSKRAVLTRRMLEGSL